MKSSFAALVAATLAVSAGSALAADLPVRAPAPAPVLVDAPFSWNGFYVGLHAGYGWTIDDVVGIHTRPPFPNGIFRGDIGSVNPKGFVGGAQAGYNFQYGNIVFGIEDDISFQTGSSSASGIVPVAGLSRARAKLPWFGSVRGRLGFAADRFLVYATGGVGFTNVNYSLSTNAGANFGSVNRTRAGWVGGAGVEYAFTNNITARLEGLYYNVPKFRVRNTVGFRDFTEATQSHALARVGLNYKF